MDDLSGVLSENTDALVAMMADDSESLRACETAYEKYGLQNMIVRLQDMTLRDEFEELGVRVVDPGSAIVTLLDQYVRAPDAARLLMHRDPEYDVVQVTVTDKDIDGVLLRDLRLPTDVLILEISRNGQGIVPHGYSRIHMKDALTLVGKPQSLKQVTLQLGY
jgi:Trk K+ transport system NAD-binding subunit